jgi:hypothetical protein
VLTDIQVITGPGAGFSWQTVASSNFIAQDKIKLAQTVSLSISTPGGRGRIEVWVVVSDMLGRDPLGECFIRLAALQLGPTLVRQVYQGASHILGPDV